MEWLVLLAVVAATVAVVIVLARRAARAGRAEEGSATGAPEPDGPRYYDIGAGDGDGGAG